MSISTPDEADETGGALEPDMERALEWLVSLHSGNATAAEWEAFAAWRAASPERHSAASAAERLWAAIGPAARPPRTARIKATAAALALGASLLVGLFAGGGLVADHRTATGERRTLTLADGSRLEMDSATRVDVSFEHGRRRLILHAGEIHVSVSPDAARPFDVEAAGATIRALGTAFDVRRDGDRVRVAVTEHAVRVTYSGRGVAAETRVPAGEQVTFGPDEGLGRPAPARLNELTGWRRGRLIFDGRPLGEVVAEMGRYRHGMVVVTDQRLWALPVTGVFDTGDAEGLLEAVAEILPVTVHELPWLAVIQPAPEPAAAPSR